MFIGFDSEVRSAADNVAKHDKELHQDAGRVCFSLRFNLADVPTSQAVKGIFRKLGPGFPHRDREILCGLSLGRSEFGNIAQYSHHQLPPWRLSSQPAMESIVREISTSGKAGRSLTLAQQ